MADQHNDNIPAVGNQVANDIPDIKENLEFHKDVFQNFCNTWSNTAAGGLYPKTMADADADTLIQMEESADEDTIRFDCAGAEYVTIDATNGLSTDKISELTADNGVVIDGCTIKDGGVDGLADNTLTMADVNPNLIYITGAWNEVSTNNTVYTTLEGCYFLIPPGPTQLHLFARMKGDGSNNAYCRLKVNAGTSSPGNRTTASYDWVDCGTLDISGETPGENHNIEIQMAADSGGTSYVSGWTIIFE